MKCTAIVSALNLHNMGIVLGVYNKNFLVIPQCDVRLHNWKEINNAIVKVPVLILGAFALIKPRFLKAFSSTLQASSLVQDRPKW